MNILIANWTWFPSGGDWTYIENVSRLYEANGHRVVPFSMKDPRNLPSPYSDYFISNINYKDLNVNRNLSAGMKVLSKSIYSKEAQKCLEALLDQVDIQLAHINLIHHYITPSILKVLKKRGIRVIWTLHDYTPICPESTFISNGAICEACKGGKFYNTVRKKCKKGALLPSLAASIENYTHHIGNFYEEVDHFICPSKFSYEKYKEFAFYPEKLHHVYHGYEFSDGEPESSPAADYILYVGRLERIKGVHTLLKAMKLNPSIKLKIIGDGTEEAHLRAMVADLGMKNIEFLGKKNKKEVWAYIRGAFFLVCPSEWYEVLGFTIVEAMMIGKPVIGAEIGAIPETVVDGTTGFLFEPGNENALSEKIKTLYADKILIAQLGANAKAHAEKLFDPQHHFRRLKEIIPAL